MLYKSNIMKSKMQGKNTPEVNIITALAKHAVCDKKWGWRPLNDRLSADLRYHACWIKQTGLIMQVCTKVLNLSWLFKEQLYFYFNVLGRQRIIEMSAFGKYFCTYFHAHNEIRVGGGHTVLTSCILDRMSLSYKSNNNELIFNVSKDTAALKYCIVTMNHSNWFRSYSHSSNS
jgi:hypothetical protein